MTYLKTRHLGCQFRLGVFTAFMLACLCSVKAQGGVDLPKLQSWRDSNDPLIVAKAKQAYEKLAEEKRQKLHSLSLQQKTNAENEIVFYVYNAAICNNNLGNEKAAVTSLENVVAEFPDSQIIVLVHAELGFIYQRAWQALDSERCLEKAEQLVKKAQATGGATLPPSDIERIKLSRAINYVTLGKDSLARARLAELSKSRSVSVSVEAKQQLATLDFNADRPYAAINGLRACLSTIQTIQPRNRESVLHEFSCRIGLARYFRQHGRFADGKKELGVARSLLNGNQNFLLPSEKERHLVELDNAMGELLLESTWAVAESSLGQVEITETLAAAEQFAKAALSISSKSKRNSKEAATSTTLLANIAWRRGMLQIADGNRKDGNESFRSAIDKFSEAIQYYEDLSGQLPIVPELKRNKAFLSVISGDTNAALVNSKQLLAQSEAAYGKGSLPTVLHHDLLSLIYAQTGETSLSFSHADQSRRIYNQALPIHAAGLTPAALQMFFRRWEEPAFHSALRLTVKNPDQAAKGIEWLANGKAKSSEILALISQSLSNSLKRNNFYGAIQQQAACLYGAITDEIEDVENALLSLEERKRLNLEQSPVPQEVVWINLSQLTAQLKQDEALIDIFALKPNLLSRNRTYFAWILRPSGKTEIVKLGDANEIDHLLNQFLTEIESFSSSETKGQSSPAYKQSMLQLRSLSQLIFKPLWERVKDVPKWIVSPDGDLWNTPWSALLLPDEDTFAVERIQFRTVIAGRDIVTRNSETNSGPAVVVADPAYDALPKDADGVWRDEKTLVAAPLSTEGNRVYKQIKASKQVKPILMSGHDATETQLATLQSPPSLLYMATHGLFLQRSDLHVEDPFLCCFLALEGYNFLPTSKQSVPGVLTGSDVLLLNLEGTSLVVLSACQTGRGISAYGHSSASLRHAFHLAGAKAVVATVWSIPSKQTSEVMLGLIQNLYANGNTYQSTDRAYALQKAQLEYLTSMRLNEELANQGYTHPFYWAAFSISGF